MSSLPFRILAVRQLDSLRQASSAAALLALLAGCGSTDSTAAHPEGAAGTANAAGSGGAGNSGGEAAGAGGGGAGSGGSGTGGDGGGNSGPKELAPEASCAPSGEVCATPTKVSNVFASYRKDAFFDDGIYNEYTDPPVDGGRVHVIATAQVSGNVTDYTIDGIDPDVIYTENSAETAPFEWTHIWPTRFEAGDQIWVSFHSRDSKWDALTSSRLVVRTDAGVAVDADFPVATTGPVQLTYVTFEDDLSTAVLHLKNTASGPHDIARVIFNGRDVTADDVACVPYPQLLPGESTRITVPLCERAATGDVWTAAVEFDQETAPAAGGGRVLRTFFPVEAWNNTTECPWPGGNDEKAAGLLANGVDTHYMHGGVCNGSNCDCSTPDVLDIYANDAHLNVLVTDDIITDFAPIADTSGIAAVSTGDESDGEIYDDEGVPEAAKKAANAREVWALHPELSVFNGGKTNGHVGTFAGMTDIQGMDVYIGGCAPHITQWGTHPPVRMPYDYLRNTRDNHMPLPTWLYAQGLSPVGAWKAQPSASEVLAQGIMVIAAGGKGLMWFQANQEKAAEVPASWQAMEDVNRITRGVRHWLRVGDPVGNAKSTGNDIVESIPAGDAIVVPVISLDVTAAPTDLTCALTSNPHVWDSVTREVSVDVPRDMALRAVYEVTPAGAVAVQNYTVSGRRVTIAGVQTDDNTPARVFVLAASENVAERINAGVNGF
jgi:hypothetical protein